ncbi:MAG: GUN4 domain-containing protein [Cyanobacteria bacterium P01_A01_bin.37]
MARAALLIGIREYGSELESLPASPRDVEAFSAVLKKQELGLFHPVITLSDDPQSVAVSKNGIESSLENWCSSHHSGDIALLYVSGHLILDRHNEVFLASNETHYENGLLIRSSAVSGTFIRQCLQRSAASIQLIILDCCVHPIDPCTTHQSPHSLDIVRHFWGDRRVVLLSSADFRYSPAQKQDRLSIYTQFLVEGIVTGLADGDGDQQISIQELHEYVGQKLQIATPAIAPKIFTSSDSKHLTMTAMASAQVSAAHRRYCTEAGRFIERHGIDGSPVSHQALSALKQQLGIRDDLAEILNQTVLTPYTIRNTSLAKYREIAAQFIQSEPFSHPDADAQLDGACYQLGLTEAVVDPINQELRYLHQLRRLEQYRHALIEALKLEQPLSTGTQQDLTDLCQSLGIPEQDERMINSEVEAHWHTHKQKLAQYRLKFQQAIDSGVAKNPLIREELDNFRQSLELSNQDIEPIEQEVQNAMTSSSIPPDSSSNNPQMSAEDLNDLQQRQTIFKKAFIKAANHRLPPTPEDQQRLDILQQELQLPLDWVNSFKANVFQMLKEQESAYQESVDYYEQQFQALVDQVGFPLSEEIRQGLYDLENDLHIKAHDVRAIEQTLYSHWQAQQVELEQQETSDKDGGDYPDSMHSSDGLTEDGLVDELNPPDPTRLEERPQKKSALPPTELENDLHFRLSNTTTLFSDVSASNRPSFTFAETPESAAQGAIDSSIQQQVEPLVHSHGLLLGSDDPLYSDRNIDYRTLRRLLNDHDWREADNETLSILVRLAKAGQPDVEWPDPRAIHNLPETDLYTIDRLWSYYSEGKFGFREQYRIYDATATYSKHDRYAAYGKAVKWMLFDEFPGFKYYNQLIFDHRQAPHGHLPAKWFWEISPWESLRCGGLGTGRGGCGHDGGLLSNLMNKLRDCRFLMSVNPSE